MTTSLGDVAALSARSFLLGDGAASLEDRLAESGARHAVQEGVEGLGDSVLAGATGQIASMASDFLALDLASVVVSGLKKHDELLTAAQATRGTSDVAMVRLGTRDICLTQHPTIDVVLGGVTVTVIRFELSVTATIVGVAGMVADGTLVSLQGGRCDLAVTFGAAGRCIAERSATFDPQLTIPLGPGIPLGLPRQRGQQPRASAS